MKRLIFYVTFIIFTTSLHANEIVIKCDVIRNISDVGSILAKEGKYVYVLNPSKKTITLDKFISKTSNLTQYDRKTVYHVNKISKHEIFADDLNTNNYFHYVFKNNLASMKKHDNKDWKLVKQCRNIDQKSLFLFYDILEKNSGYLVSNEESSGYFVSNQETFDEKISLNIENNKKLCKQMGFKDDSDGMPNCILQLTLERNKGQNTIVTNTTPSNNFNDQNKQKQKELNLMQQQTNIMKKKLEQQQKEFLIQQQELETQQKMLEIERQRQLERAKEIFDDLADDGVFNNSN